jgi:CRP/FNR family cyclic AMP-dependent transcriptional regulator
MELKALPKANTPFDWTGLPSIVKGSISRDYKKKGIVFAQGAPADDLFHVEKGRVKLSVVSKQGKEAIIAIFGAGDFFGEDCLTGLPLRIATARAVTDCSLLRLPKAATGRALTDDPGFSEVFIAHLLSRNLKVQEDLVDQLFNSSEKRLARLLLLLANFGKDGKHELVIPKMSQETLAEMIGTTRSRVSFFMNKFRDLGFIDYKDGLKVHSSLLSVVLHD